MKRRASNVDLSTVRHSLRAHAVTKTYGQTKALAKATFEIASGEVVALLGPNGAGKTTLLRVLSGLTEPDRGYLSINDERVAFPNPAAALACGIVLVPQEPSLCNDLSVLENIWLGVERPAWWEYAAQSQRSLRTRIRQALASFGHPQLPLETPCANLTLGERQLVVLARALLSHARLVLLDEPATTMGGAEVRAVLQSIREIASGGTAVLFSTHRADIAGALAERVLMLRDGHLTQSSSTRVLEDASAKPTATARRRDADHTPSDREPVLRFLSHSSQSTAPFQFIVKVGEIVALEGPPLQTLSRFLRGIAGVRTLPEGAIYVAGEKVVPTCPRDALAAGIAYVTPDRGGEGIFEGLTVATNITIGVASKLPTRLGLLFADAEIALSQELAKQLRLPEGRMSDDAGWLSGGNQQRVVLARAIATRPRVLVLDNPTRGLDSQGRRDLASYLRSFRGRGGACILTAPEDEFVSGVVDRVIQLEFPTAPEVPSA